MDDAAPGATPRRSMHLARKKRIWKAWGGRCACGVEVPVTGAVVYDHSTQLWLGGPEIDASVRPLCLDCNRSKTAIDASVRAKVKRLHKKAVGQPREPSQIKSRGFQKNVKRRILSRVEPGKEAAMARKTKPKPKVQTEDNPPAKVEKYKMQVGPAPVVPGSRLKPMPKGRSKYAL